MTPQPGMYDILVEFESGQRSYVEYFVPPDCLPQNGPALNYEVRYGDSPMPYKESKKEQIVAILSREKGVKSVTAELRPA